MPKNAPTNAGTADACALAMQSFFPYRLAVLAEEVSRKVAAIYETSYGLSRAEWRVLAALADLGPSPARDLGTYSTLDKMQVSRALADMEAKGLVSRSGGRADRRTKVVRLTFKGTQLFETLLPKVRAQEATLLACLDDGQRAAFFGAMAVLSAHLAAADHET